MTDYSSLIADRTSNFTGREWVFTDIDRWLATPDAPRYFFIVGEPGIGKTAIAARLTQLHNLAATHFCIAGQADTIDPLNFARSLSSQLTQIDSFARGLLKNSGIELDLVQNIQENFGQVIGVRIETLIINAPAAAVAFTQVVVEPLKMLYRDGFDRQLIILVDALDEAIQQPGPENIVNLLANAGGLPSLVRFVLTSRLESEALRHFARRGPPHLVLNADRRENRLTGYLYKQRGEDERAEDH